MFTKILGGCWCCSPETVQTDECVRDGVQKKMEEEENEKEEGEEEHVLEDDSRILSI